MQMICMLWDVADDAEADVFGAWPLKPSLKFGAGCPGFSRGFVERLLERVIDEDVLDCAFAKPRLDEAPLACGVEVARMQAPMCAGRTAALEVVADVDITARLVASMLIERASVGAAGVADFDAWGMRVGITQDIEGMQELVGGVLGHVGAGALADDETWMRRDGNSVNERAVICPAD